MGATGSPLSANTVHDTASLPGMTTRCNLTGAQFDISGVFDPTTPTAGGSQGVVLAHHRPPSRTGSQLFRRYLSREHATPVRWRIPPHQPDGLQTRVLDAEQPELLFLIDQTSELAHFDSHGGLVSTFGSIKAIKRLSGLVG
jgi:hypothetical protein